MLQFSLVQFLSDGTANWKLVILAFLYCEEFVNKSAFQYARFNGHH